MLVAEPGREVEAATRLGRIGFDTVAGYLDGGMQSLDAEPGSGRAHRADHRCVARRAAGRGRSADAGRRARAERVGARRHIDGAVNMPLSRLPERIVELPRDRSIVVHCASGYRSAIAASLLRREGYAFVSDLVGGMPAWEAAVEPAGP